jgi:hypothetical protein
MPVLPRWSSCFLRVEEHMIPNTKPSVSEFRLFDFLLLHKGAPHPHVRIPSINSRWRDTRPTQTNNGAGDRAETWNSKTRSCSHSCSVIRKHRDVSSAIHEELHRIATNVQFALRRCVICTISQSYSQYVSYRLKLEGDWYRRAATRKLDCVIHSPYLSLVCSQCICSCNCCVYSIVYKYSQQAASVSLDIGVDSLNPFFFWEKIWSSPLPKKKKPYHSRICIWKYRVWALVWNSEILHRLVEKLLFTYLCKGYHQRVRDIELIQMSAIVIFLSQALRLVTLLERESRFETVTPRGDIVNRPSAHL